MLKKKLARIARHKGIRKKVIGTSERPRVCVFRSLKHIAVQAIDDAKAATICATSTSNKEFLNSVKKVSKTQKAEKLGEVFATQLKAKGVAKISFDRAGYKYHGRIKAFADSLRKAGIQF